MAKKRRKSNKCESKKKEEDKVQEKNSFIVHLG